MREFFTSSHGARLGLLLAVLGLAPLGCNKRQTITPPPPPILFTSEAALIKGLEAAYQRRDYEKFKLLFSNPTQPIPAQPSYEFFLSEPTPTENSWGYPEEMRIHRRMFRPQDTLPGDNPVPTDLWLQSVDITLTKQAEFVEREDLYSSPSNPNGLDAGRWRATEAVYATEVFFRLAGSTDYLVNGHANFVVIQDLTKTNDDQGKWLIYRWEDLAHKPSAAKPLATTSGAPARVELRT